jgi:Bacterial Ig-like domain
LLGTRLIAYEQAPPDLTPPTTSIFIPGIFLAIKIDNVIDEYGVTQPSGSVTVQANGTYSFTLTLPATKQGSDKDGHLYTIVVTGVDQAGNSATATTTLTIN